MILIHEASWRHHWLPYEVAFTSFFGNAHANSMLLRVNILPIFHSTNFPHWSKFELFTSTNFPSLYLTVYKYAVEEIAFYLLISSKMFRQINFRHIFMEPLLRQLRLITHLRDRVIEVGVNCVERGTKPPVPPYTLSNH